MLVSVTVRLHEKWQVPSQMVLKLAVYFGISGLRASSIITKEVVSGQSCQGRVLPPAAPRTAAFALETPATLARSTVKKKIYRAKAPSP